MADWFFVGNVVMGCWDYLGGGGGALRAHHRDPFHIRHLRARDVRPRGDLSLAIPLLKDVSLSAPRLARSWSLQRF